MASSPASTFTTHDVTLRSRTHFVADATVFIAVVVVFWVLVQLSHGITQPFDAVTAPSSVSTDPALLPYYAARSLLRMFAALASEIRLMIGLLRSRYHSLTELYDEHAALLAALQAGEVEHALALWTSHIDDAETYLLQSLPDGDPDLDPGEGQP